MWGKQTQNVAKKVFKVECSGKIGNHKVDGSNLQLLTFKCFQSIANFP